MTRTYSPKQGEVERRWYVVDAAGVPLGRLSTAVARVLAASTSRTTRRTSTPATS